MVFCHAGQRSVHHFSVHYSFSVNMTVDGFNTDTAIQTILLAMSMLAVLIFVNNLFHVDGILPEVNQLDLLLERSGKKQCTFLFINQSPDKSFPARSSSWKTNMEHGTVILSPFSPQRTSPMPLPSLPCTCRVSHYSVQIRFFVHRIPSALVIIEFWVEMSACTAHPYKPL